MPRLRLRLKRRGALFLDHRDVLPAEGVPAEPWEVGLGLGLLDRQARHAEEASVSAFVEGLYGRGWLDSAVWDCGDALARTVSRRGERTCFSTMPKLCPNPICSIHGKCSLSESRFLGLVETFIVSEKPSSP